MTIMNEYKKISASFLFSVNSVVTMLLIFSIHSLAAAETEINRTTKPDSVTESKNDQKEETPAVIMHGGHLRLLEKLREENPQRYVELMQLRKENPELFRSAMREQLMEMRRSRDGRFAPRDRAIVELVRRFHEAESRQEQENLKEKIKEQLSNAFDERIERYERNLEAMKERLERIRQELKKQQENRQRLIEEQLDFLTGKNDDPD